VSAVGLAARFEVITGRAAGMSILVEDELVIGRQGEGAGRLADDEEISRLHAHVVLDEDGSCTIEDLGSTNGTYVNGARVSGLKTLAEGDMIELGGTTLVVRELPTAAPAQVLEPQTRMTTFASAAPNAALQQDPVVAGPTPEQEPQTAFPGPSPSPEPPTPQPATSREPTELPPPPVPVAPPGPAEMREPVAPADTAAGSAPLAPPGPGVRPEPVESSEPPGPPPLALRLEVDFAGLEARLALDPSSDPVEFVFEAGAWRLNPMPSTQEGGLH
jgi:pSer/pThr/pTyr-binding forkhead associated (FHA) protein